MEMKIVLLIGDITTGGGSERVVSNLANAFCQNYEVELLSIYKTNQNPAFTLDSKVKLSFLHHKKRAAVRKGFYKLIDKFYEGFLLKKRYKNCIMIYNNMPHYPMFKNKNTHYLCLLHERQNKYRKKFNTYDMLITLTNEQTNFLKNFHKKVINIPNFLPQIPIQSTNPSQKIVLNLGRFSKEKGPLRLIDVWKKVQEGEEFKEWKLIFVGEGDLKKEMQEKITSHNLTSTTLIKTFTKDVESEYLSASIYALSSFTEGFGMVLIESASYALASIAFEIDSINELIENEKSGFLVKNDDLNAYAKKLQTLMRDENLRKSMGERAKKLTLERFSKETILKKWQDLFDSYQNFSSP